MASEKPEKAKKEKKDKKDKKHKLAETEGVTKPKKEKKRKSKDASDALHNQLENSLDGTEVEASAVAQEGDKMEVDSLVITPIGALVPFANPLADEKQTKKVLKAVKKSAKNKTLKRGVKEVVKSLRKSPVTGPPSGSTSDPIGVVIIAADISPIDVISHLPVLCEDHNIPYIYVTSRAELGAAGSTKRATSVVMVAKDRGTKPGKDGSAVDEDYKEAYADLVKLVHKAQKSVTI